MLRSKLTELVKQGVEDPAHSLTSSAGVVTNDGCVGAGNLLALLQVEFGRNLDGLGREAVLNSVREQGVRSEIWVAYADSDLHGLGLGKSSGAGEGGSRNDQGDVETHFDGS